ncbi:calcium-binding EGF-like domain-containing protein [Bythopirellula goksoeyrii]|uniref:Uncharacterized protein n=1 Tax=Bythopirellula goksoeyrii TaxID=1400387 RepID=A0A5B9Q3Z7_9BACT|nr:calcium-binding EGF-like domain-containing protein [Bythopirellula goksoeyrii]QEG33758.1 hypothetical protein Pr1d_10280 [Bythopirellula goksoeyrii]
MARASKLGMGIVGLGLSMELLLGMAGQSDALANECQPPTPCPCAADGTCHPKSDTWGSYKTRWRPWPGDKVGLTPDEAEDTKSNIKQNLPTYQPPRPEQEELRGPAKKSPASGAATPDASDAVPQAEPAAEGADPAGQEFELPGLPGIPEFDPQGYLPPGRPQLLPQPEDGPPALPQSLSASLAETPSYIAPRSQPQSGPTVVANQSHSAAIPTVVGHVVQATAEFQQASEIQLTNPAAANIYKPTDDELHQAIYIESSDISASNE